MIEWAARDEDAPGLPRRDGRNYMAFVMDNRTGRRHLAVFSGPACRLAPSTSGIARMRPGRDDSTRLGGQYRVGVWQTQPSRALVRARGERVTERDGGGLGGTSSVRASEGASWKDGMGLSAGTRRDICCERTR